MLPEQYDEFQKEYEAHKKKVETVKTKAVKFKL